MAASSTGAVVVAMGATGTAVAALPCDGVQVSWVDAAGAELRGSLAASWGVAFEDVRPVRSFGSFKGQRSFQGAWWFATTGKHVGFESWLERPIDRTNRLPAARFGRMVTGAACPT